MRGFSVASLARLLLGLGYIALDEVSVCGVNNALCQTHNSFCQLELLVKDIETCWIFFFV